MFLMKRGAYGEVRLAYQKFTNSKFAIKIIPKKKMTFDVNKFS
jgi:serine/threonine protein kinase